MSARRLYRTIALLMVLFAVAHTFGFLHFRPPTAQAAAVRDAMSQVRFQVRGGSASFGDFYVGFGLSISLYLLFLAFLAWQLGNLAVTQPRSARPLAWAFFVLQAACAAISWRWIALPPAVVEAVVAICGGWAAAQLRVATASSESPR